MKAGPLRTGLLGVAVILTGYALFAAWLGIHAASYLDARDRATERAQGVVVADGLGEDGDIRVRWTDAGDHTHVQRFAVYDTDRYAKGRMFPVLYDPAAAHPRGFPADQDETATEDDLIGPIFVGAGVALPLLGAWVWRGLRFRRTARRPGRPMTARVRTGSRYVTNGHLPAATWLELTTPEGRTHWQRVMWHPALHAPPATLTVTVHGTRGPRVVTLPDGTRLVPLGRFRDRLSRKILLDDEVSRADLRDAFVLPPDTAALDPVPPWRQGARTAAVSALVGVVLGAVLSSGDLPDTVAFALGTMALFTASWALGAPQP